jgi:FtsP/CotA-like multicopper oxidase with cupredoxin domain
MRILIFAVLGLLISSAAPAASSIATSNNKETAGTTRNGLTQVRLDIMTGNWHPEEDDGPSLTIQAFAEEGKLPQIPGPTIRLAEGSNVLVTIHNSLRVPAELHGLPPAYGESKDAITIRPGASRSIRFSASKAGHYLYWASTTRTSLFERHAEDSQLSGVLIVEPAEQARRNEVPVFVLGHWWRDKDPRELWVINGKMWPFTPRLTEKVKEPMRTVWINASDEDHPMHLHGTYFSVLRESINGKDVTHGPNDTPFVVTHVLQAGGFMEIEWTHERPGNWLFHCHILFHTDFGLGLDPPKNRPMHMAHSSKHMAGLAVGFTAINPMNRDLSASSDTVRKLKLIVSERNASYETIPGYGLPDKLIGVGYQLEEDNVSSNPNPLAPGPPIILTRNQPVEITVENHLNEATSIHWHGMELESFYDGVAGWGGETDHITPSIQAHESFVVKFIPPRAGSFMYHTHLNDVLQLSLGLAGPLVVIEDAKKFDPDRDKLFMITRDGLDDEKAPFLINGKSFPAPIQMRSGRTYRLRFFELTTAKDSRVSIIRKDGRPVQWQPVAKDGADLPEPLRALRPANMIIETGETYDFLFTPEAGDYRLEGTDGRWRSLFAVEMPVSP